MALDIVATLAEHRQRLGLTQHEVSRRMGTPARSIVCDLESRRRQPTLPTLLAWCEALDVDLTVALRPAPSSREASR